MYMDEWKRWLKQCRFVHLNVDHSNLRSKTTDFRSNANSGLVRVRECRSELNGPGQSVARFQTVAGMNDSRPQCPRRSPIQQAGATKDAWYIQRRRPLRC